MLKVGFGPVFEVGFDVEKKMEILGTSACEL